MSLTGTLTEELEEEEEDTELRDLVTNVLKQKGILGQMKAELRSNVYLSLDSGHQIKSTSSRSALDTFLSGSSDGRLLLQLVREFLAFFDLKFSLSVFEPEAGLDATCKSRDQLIEGLGLGETLNHRSGAGAKTPILAEILRLSKVSILKSETPTPTDRYVAAMPKKKNEPLALRMPYSSRTEDESSMPSSLDSATATTNKSSSVNPHGGNHFGGGFTSSGGKGLDSAGDKFGSFSASGGTAATDKAFGSSTAAAGSSPPVGSVKPNTASALTPLGGDPSPSSSTTPSEAAKASVTTAATTTPGSLDGTYTL